MWTTLTGHAQPVSRGSVSRPEPASGRHGASRVERPASRLATETRAVRSHRHRSHRTSRTPFVAAPVATELRTQSIIDPDARRTRPRARYTPGVRSGRVRDQRLALARGSRAKLTSRCPPRSSHRWGGGLPDRPGGPPRVVRPTWTALRLSAWAAAVATMGSGTRRRHRRRPVMVTASATRPTPTVSCGTTRWASAEQVVPRRRGRGGATDDDSEMFARDVGADGAGASAEEAAVHLVEA